MKLLSTVCPSCACGTDNATQGARSTDGREREATMAIFPAQPSFPRYTTHGRTRTIRHILQLLQLSLALGVLVSSSPFTSLLVFAETALIESLNPQVRRLGPFSLLFSDSTLKSFLTRIEFGNATASNRWLARSLVQPRWLHLLSRSRLHQPVPQWQHQIYRPPLGRPQARLPELQRPRHPPSHLPPKRLRLLRLP